ncbi:MAG: hypothetical protein P0Y53_12065 [Candidatus Pseudobacter hemicellulosilyticus]|uniref:Uncharacterized protein n=1 Tax=Candidatus Pseudobacter hemicellulosilyticus TaxID=3121375 RepID=A0AAJ5WZF5_9BACT|nr:MAG: hypothetical protein P0Y53_12065 [Pseudobacter sp.]
MKQLITAGALLLAIACTDTNNTNQPDPIDSLATGQDTLTTAPAPEMRAVTGKVASIQRGKDGYTAKLITTDSQTVFVTISHANLKDHSQYRNAKVGDTLSVKGDTLTIGTEAHITVRELQ